MNTFADYMATERARGLHGHWFIYLCRTLVYLGALKPMKLIGSPRMNL
jgi:hypothetical protein